ncbi:MAG: DNA-processing protein DprA [Pseudomonadota bacterium]
MKPDQPTASQTDQQTRLDWLRLIRTENIGPVTFNKLIEFYGSAGRALAALPDMAKRGGRSKPLIAYPEKDALAELKQLEKLKGELIIKSDARYPVHLAACEDSPPVLSVLGDTALLQKQGLAIVGARNASLNGRKLAERFAHDIGAEGYPIISGLARGIDTAAHKAGLEHGTIAVIAGGLDVVYPKENQDLYEQIAEYGLLVAESPLGTQPQARHFPKRNRIIAGLSYGVLVIEAAQKSGSLITANMALDYGREVYAVPGSPLDPRAAGTNALLKNQAAHLVTGSRDVLNDLGSQRLFPLREGGNDTGWQGSPVPIANAAAQCSDDQRAECRSAILDCLSSTPVHCDEIIREIDGPPALVLAILLELELAGRVERHPGNRINIILG